MGKTTLTMGLLQAFARSMKVQPFKVGPDYIDPAFHTHITGRKCRNLDGWMLSEDTIKSLFARSGRSADLCVIEGVMGMHDGAGTRKNQGSTAHIAKILNAPVVLVLDARAMAASAAAMVLGYRDYDPEINLEGVILNNVSGGKHYDLLKTVIQRDTGIRVFGYLPPHKDISLPDRHLGLVPQGELEDLEEKLNLLGQLVRDHLDLDGLEILARQYASFSSTPSPLPDPSNHQSGGRITTAVAMDPAFHFYYWDNLELLEELGAELVYFSPLSDEKLPEGIDLLILGGGFPEVFAAQLEANKPMRQAVKHAVKQGLPVYGECGGLMYLSERIRGPEGKDPEGKGGSFSMVGAFPGTTAMTGRLQRFGYVEVENRSDNLLGLQGTRFRAHEFHYSVLEGAPEHLFSMHVYKIRDGEITDTWLSGIKTGCLLASYPHLHFYANLSVPRALLQSGLEYRKRSV